MEKEETKMNVLSPSHRIDREVSDTLLSYLPSRLSAEILNTELHKIDEIRLRAGGLSSLSSDKRNVTLNTILTQKETDNILRLMCDCSLYAFRDTINKGYITLKGGIRVGVCGRAVIEKDKITGIYDVSSLCIRIPHEIYGIGNTVSRLVRSTRTGVLVYSLPGVGKTTLLRSVISTLASGDTPMRVAVIDTRGELSSKLQSRLSVDLLSGYPKGEGIEIASRTLNPELIVCDEIGADMAEISAIKAAHNCGVPLLATSHADSVSGLLRRTGISVLHEANIFGAYVGITRGSGKDYRYEITPYDRATNF